MCQLLALWSLWHQERNSYLSQRSGGSTLLVPATWSHPDELRRKVGQGRLLRPFPVLIFYYELEVKCWLLVAVSEWFLCLFALKSSIHIGAIVSIAGSSDPQLRWLRFGYMPDATASLMIGAYKGNARWIGAMKDGFWIFSVGVWGWKILVWLLWISFRHMKSWQWSARTQL